VAASKNGVLYGTTYYGGAAGAGTVFALQPPKAAGQGWTESVPYSFTGGSDGAYPAGGVAIGSHGELYGTTYWGGSLNYGAAFELTPPSKPGAGWTEIAIHSFGATSGNTIDGSYPFAGLAMGADGSPYGTTSLGGGVIYENGTVLANGVVFKLSPSPIPNGPWPETVIHLFSQAGDGSAPMAAPAVGLNGVVYGTASAGGATRNGAVYQLTPPTQASGKWTEIVLYSFTGQSGDGALPYAALAIGSDGAVYGTTHSGGASGKGTLFKLTPPSPGGAWSETVLHSFTGRDGDGASPLRGPGVRQGRIALRNGVAGRKLQRRNGIRGEAMRSILFEVLLLSAAALLPAQIVDGPAVTFKKYTAPTAKSEPWGLTAGPDGALWFTTGPDGALWFTEGNTNKIGRITTAGAVTAEYPIPTTTSYPWEIVAGPDGALWFTELNPPFCIAFVCEAPPFDGYIERVTTDGVFTVYNLPAPIGGLASPGIVVGSDGALWFAESSNSSVGSITTAGVIGQHPLPNAASVPQGMAAGPDGAVWFTEEAANQIARITPTGVINEYSVPGSVYEIAAGPDGALWFTTDLGGKIGRITTTAGVISEYTVPYKQNNSISIVVGPDSAVWFTDSENNAVVQVVVH